MVLERKKSMRGHIHSCETFGTVDGPGIRYVLFLSGCPLRCAFCHNPDTWAAGDKTVAVQEVLADIARYRRFYTASGGGVTVSGGEPLLQPHFVAQLLAGCRSAGLHTMIDTAGFYPRQNLEMVLPYTDMAAFSIKAVDPVKHERLTGAGNAGIIANLRYVAARKPTVLRYVVIPGVNDTAADIDALAGLVKAAPGNMPVELLAYHTLGRRKWETLGFKYQLDEVRQAEGADLDKARLRLAGHSISVLHACGDGLSA